MLEEEPGFVPRPVLPVDETIADSTGSDDSLITAASPAPWWLFIPSDLIVPHEGYITHIQLTSQKTGEFYISLWKYRERLQYKFARKVLVDVPEVGQNVCKFCLFFTMFMSHIPAYINNEN